MTHDNHPTAAPLSREEIESCRNADMDTWLSYSEQLCDMALRSPTRPVPSDMAEDVELVREAMTDFFNCLECTSTTDNQQFKDAKKALDRIVAHLSPRDAAPSGDMEYGIEISGDDANRLAQCIDADYVINKIGTTRDKNRIGNIANLIRHYGDQARAEGLEMAAKECEKLCELPLDVDDRRISRRCQKAIRALIPAGQQTKGDGK